MFAYHSVLTHTCFTCFRAIANARVAKHARRNTQMARKHALRRACGGRVPLVLPAWRDAVWRAHRRRLFALRAEGARARSLTKKAVEAWKRSLLDARVSSHLAEAQGLVHRAKHTANVMRAWFGEARRRRTARALVAARVESARDEASVKACFGFWEEWTQRRVAKHKVRVSHRAVRSRFVRAVSFRGWALYAAYARELGRARGSQVLRVDRDQMLARMVRDGEGRRGGQARGVRQRMGEGSASFVRLVTRVEGPSRRR